LNTRLQDSKSFFSYVRSKNKVKTTVGPLKDDKDILVTSDQKMSELLNDYFASVFTKENTTDLPAVKSVYTGEENEKLCNFLISPQMVLDKLKKLKMNKAPGVDLIGTTPCSKKGRHQTHGRNSVIS